MAKVKNKRNAGLADKVQNKKKAKATKKTLNPFEVHINREKLKVLGKKSKHDRGLPGVSRAKAIQKRKETLGTEMKLMNKTNAFIDRRIGEKDNQISTEDRMVARFAAERAKQHSKKSIYNLADDEILTHRGQTLEQIEKFDDPRSSDDEDEEKRFGGLGNDFVAEGHFGGGVLSKSESKDGAKSHKDLIEQLIAESKKRKAEKQKEKEHTLDLTEKLDSEWKDLQPVVFKCQKEKEESLIEKLLSREEKGQDYDMMMRELRFEKRGTPSDGLKSKEKQEEEERKKIEELERQRQQRMFSEEELALPKNAPTSKHRSADDLDDNFELDNPQEFMLAYDKDGKPLVPEHVLKDFSVPNARKKFEDGISDSSGDEAGTESGDESDDEEDDQENDENSDDNDDESSKKGEVDQEEGDDDSSGDDSDEILVNNVKNKNVQKKSKEISDKVQIDPKDRNDDNSDGDDSDEISSKELNINVNEKKRSKELYSDDETDTKRNTNSKENTNANNNVKIKVTENNMDQSVNSKSEKVIPHKKDKDLNLKRKISESDEESDSNSDEDCKGFGKKQINSDKKIPKLLDPDYFHSKNDDTTSKMDTDTKKSKLLYPDYFPPKKDDNMTKTELQSNGDKTKPKLLYPDYFPPKNDDGMTKNDNQCSLNDENYSTNSKYDKNNEIDDENDSQSSEGERDSDIDDFKDLKGTDESNDELEDCTERIGSFFDLKSAEGDNLKELLTGKTPAQQSAALEKLIKSYDPSLGESNKENLSRLYAHLLQYTHDLFSNLNNESDIIKSFLVFNKLVPYFYDLIQINKVSTKKFTVELLKEKHDQFKRNPKKVPDLDTLIFFKLVSILYPTSDFRHPVTTPSLIFMTEILTHSRFRDAYSVSRGFFIVSLILEYIVLSKRYVPEALNFLRGIFYLSANTSVLNPIQVVPPFRLHRDVKILNLERDCSKMAVDEKMAGKDLLLTEIDDSYKIRCLLTSTLMLKEFFDNYNDLEALSAIFEPHIQLLGRVDLELYPNNVSAKVSEVSQYMKQSLEVKTYTQMAREKVRPKALRLYEPDIQDVFTGSKSGKMSRESAERARLKGKYKKEMKGALREIRRDKAYIASVKIRQKIHSDNVRKEKVKQIYKDASIQQGELNKIKRGK